MTIYQLYGIELINKDEESVLKRITGVSLILISFLALVGCSSQDEESKRIHEEFIENSKLEVRAKVICKEFGLNKHCKLNKDITKGSSPLRIISHYSRRSKQDNDFNSMLDNISPKMRRVFYRNLATNHLVQIESYALEDAINEIYQSRFFKKHPQD